MAGEIGAGIDSPLYVADVEPGCPATDSLGSGSMSQRTHRLVNRSWIPTSGAPQGSTETRVRRIDPAAVGILWRQHHDYLVRVARYRFCPERCCEPEDLVSDVFAALLAGTIQPPFRPDRWRSYLAAAVRHRALHVIRSDRHLVALTKAPIAPAITEHVTDETERCEAMRGAVIELPPQMRRVAELYWGAGKTITNIATDLLISPHTVRAHLSRAKQRLRRVLC